MSEITHVGFTGTRNGMTKAQKDRVGRILEFFNTELVVHHGDCIGSDAEFHEICRAHVPTPAIVLHPPDIDTRRAHCRLWSRDTLMPPRPYLDRNRAIVLASDVLIATPAEMTRQTRGGTWFTIDFGCRTLDPRRIFVVLPDGTRGLR